MLIICQVENRKRKDREREKEKDFGIENDRSAISARLAVVKLSDAK